MIGNYKYLIVISIIFIFLYKFQILNIILFSEKEEK